MQCVFTRLRKLDEIIGRSDDNTIITKPILERMSLIELIVEQLKRQLTLSTNSAEGNDSTQMSAIADGTEEQMTENGAMSVHRNEDRGSLHSENIKIIEDVLAVLNREVEKLTGDGEAVERQRQLERDLMETMERKVRSVERTLALKDVTIAELEQRLTEMEQTSYDGTLLWKVTDFNRRRQDAISGRTTSFYSPPFYTSKTGWLN